MVVVYFLLKSDIYICKPNNKTIVLKTDYTVTLKAPMHPSGAFKISIIFTNLPYQHHFQFPGKTSCLEFNDEYSAGNILSLFVFSIPLDLVLARADCAVKQGSDFLPQDAVNRDLDVGCFGDLVTDRCLGIKGVGIVSIELVGQ